MTEPKPRVLVVDDESAARSALTQLLEDEGYEVRAAGDAYKAIGRTDGWAPDLVITDLAMPGMDGVELMGRLRAKAPHLPVVVMTAHGSVVSAVRALQQGADDYLAKPLNFDHLLLVVRRTLERLAQVGFPVSSSTVVMDSCLSPMTSTL